MSQKIQIRPGFVVMNTSSARGGVHYRQIDRDEQKIGGALRAQHTTIKTVDNIDAVKLIDACVKKADSICRRYCARTGFGWYIPPHALGALRQELRDLSQEADKLNVTARLQGSARRAYIGLVVAELDVVSGDAAREVARTVRDTLADLREKLYQGDLEHLPAPLQRARNLDQLVIGLPGEAVRIALESVRGWRVQLRDGIEKGIAPATVGEQLDLQALDTAIAWYTEGEGFDSGPLVA